ncbi:branched-chain amino acid transport system ATP-binding protein [Pseudochelatococcus lubricantis]|uniref:Branched-chain amino acid transport system ATP-binding protein n=1 Tax=Pseudochelatococcus lubricantis TaxID=1538102 RepID=A0ABX0UXI3_9HYPH|nr:ABC transporter ATP-binding protein [Pseudochelatococcus lubricantis]NIJ56600.1 branched-chain amino acid transport system ATP-binding protein [Pseudochelatococcus lubricantis]
MLEVENVEASYGSSQVLFGMSFHVNPGEVVTLMGRNGMGKTTTISSVMGLLKLKAGTVRLNGEVVSGLPPHRIARLGVGIVPEGRRIFPNLTVRENLLMAAANHRKVREPWTLNRVIDFFPRLGERLHNGGNQLSGGEQQMLAIGRALMTNPQLLVLDEAMEGLAPIVRDEIWARLHELKKTGLTLILVDKEVESLAGFADRHYIVEKGEVVWEGDTPRLLSDEESRMRYLSV